MPANSVAFGASGRRSSGLLGLTGRPFNREGRHLAPAFEKIRSLRKFKFYRAASDTVLATAATLFVFCDQLTGKPLSIPREVQQAYTVVSRQDEP